MEANLHAVGKNVESKDTSLSASDSQNNQTPQQTAPVKPCSSGQTEPGAISSTNAHENKGELASTTAHIEGQASDTQVVTASAAVAASDQEAAAVKIQAHVRGHAARKSRTSSAVADQATTAP